MPGPAMKNEAIAKAMAILSGLPREAMLQLLMSPVFREGAPLPRWLGSAGTIPEDERYLRQYMFPERDILPRVGTEHGMAVRRMRLEPDAHFKLGEDQETQDHPFIADLPGLIPGTRDLESRLMGLGGYAVTPQGDTMRIEDNWDFKSPRVNKIFGQIMDSFLGTPFKIREDIPVR